MRTMLEKFHRTLENEASQLNVFIYLLEKRRRKKPYMIYKLLFDESVKNSISEIIQNEVMKFMELAQEDIPEYNPDMEQDLFRVDKDEIEVLRSIYSSLTEEKIPEILNQNSIKKSSTIKAWIVRVEFENEGKTQQFFFFQKFSKSQFLMDRKRKILLILGNDEYEILSKPILGIGLNFDVLLIDDSVISKNRETFEYIFDFEEFYKSKASELICTIEEQMAYKFNVTSEGKRLLEQKIASSPKRFAHKLYSAYKNGYYRDIDINKLKDLKGKINIGVNIDDNKILIDEKTNLNHLVKLLNDDFEQSLLTENIYISHKKEKVQKETK